MDVVFSLADIDTAARKFLSVINGKKVIAFHGEMGAGKTTFIHAVCTILGVTGTVGSPTYSIINEYGLGTGNSLYHIDLYRLKDEEEAVRAGVEDCLYSGAHCLVEWPERAPGLFPDDTVHVYMEAMDEQTRRMRVEDK